MIWFLLESLGALALLVLLVWWTMFSGRERGELVQVEPPSPDMANSPESEEKRP